MEQHVGEGWTVLVAEDDEAIRMIVQDMLEDVGYRVVAASNAQEALARLGEQDVSLIVTDVSMPGPMNGVALAREARRRSPSTEILFCSGYHLQMDETGGVERARVLHKPFRRELFLGTVQAMLEASRLHAGLPSPA